MEWQLSTEYILQMHATCEIGMGFAWKVVYEVHVVKVCYPHVEGNDTGNDTVISRRLFLDI